MKLMDLLRRAPETEPRNEALARFLDGFSIEVLPKTLGTFSGIDGLFPAGTRVYIAHVEGVEIADMVATAKRLTDAGYHAMPHFPARLILDDRQLADWVAMYRGEAGVTEALLLGGGYNAPFGAFHSSMQLLESGVFDRHGFTRLHVAGHPEGNPDIDPAGSEKPLIDALAWKQAFSERSDAEMAIVTQFAFDAAPVIRWAERLREAGIMLPVHVGLAGPTMLRTLLKYALFCGVGPSMKVLQRRAADVTKLLTPYQPTEIAARLAAHRAEHPETNIANAHFFPFGGVQASADWIADHARSAERRAAP